MGILRLSDVIDRHDEVLIENGKVNAALSTYDDNYIELLKRASFVEEMTKAENLSIAEIITGANDCTASAYVDFYVNGDIKVILSCDGTDGTNYCDEDIPLSEEEKDELLGNFQDFAYNTIVTFAIDTNTKIFVENDTITGELTIPSIDIDNLVLRELAFSKPNEALAEFEKMYESAETTHVYFELNAMGTVAITLQFDSYISPITCEATLRDEERGFLLLRLDECAKEAGTTIDEWLLQARGNNAPELDFKNGAHITNLRNNDDTIVAEVTIDSTDNVIELMKRSGALRETAYSIEDATSVEPDEVGFLEVTIKDNDISVEFNIENEALDWNSSGYEVLKVPLTKAEQEVLQSRVRDILGKDVDVAKKTAIERD